jgi:hypothetical protein
MPVKHIKSVSVSPVAQAAKWQEFVCILAQTFNAVLGFFGGASPLVMFLEDKCDLPTPNP